MTEPICEVVVTAPNADWLATFTRELVEHRLAACGHNFQTIRSIYRWDGSLHDTTEARVALHTRASLIPAITNEVTAKHPYQVACVIALPTIGGSDTYRDWILESTDTTGPLQIAWRR